MNVTVVFATASVQDVVPLTLPEGATVADAAARTLVRRVYFDLIGLPPSPEEVETFVKEHLATPQAAVTSASPSRHQR